MLYAELVLFVLCPTLSFAEITKLVIDNASPSPPEMSSASPAPARN